MEGVISEYLPAGVDGNGDVEVALWRVIHDDGDEEELEEYEARGHDVTVMLPSCNM